MTIRPLRICAVAALASGLAALAACTRSEGSTTASVPAIGSHSAYCLTYRAWKVYELDNGEAFDQATPTALRTWWNTYLIAEETMLQQAPTEIRDDVAVKVRHIRTVLTPLMEKYEFDVQRARRAAGHADQAALFQPPPARVQQAQEAQYAHEERTCGTAPAPPAADVVFKADASSARFCSALGAFNAELEKVAASQFDPEIMRTLVSGGRFPEVLAGLDGAAPAVIAEDVSADTDWLRTRWSDVVASYDYDLRAIFLDATPEDLAVFNRTHPDVLEHASRTTAYEDQICSA